MNDKMTLLGLLTVLLHRGRSAQLRDGTEIFVQTGDRLEPAKLIVRYRSLEDQTPIMVFVPGSEFDAASREAESLADQVQGEDPVQVLQNFLNKNLAR